MRLVAGINRLLPGKRIIGIGKRQGPGTDWTSRVISQLTVVYQRRDRIKAKPVDTCLQPETSFRKHGIHYRSMIPIEIWLAAQEVVQIVLLAPRIPLPGRTTKHRKPIV